MTLEVKYSTPLCVVEYHPSGVNESQYSMKCLAISVYYYIIEIKFSWFCRRIDEEFGDDYLLRNPEARGSGCYRNRKYKLEETSRVGGLRKINPSGSIIVVSANQP